MQTKPPKLAPCFASLTLLTSLGAAYFTVGQPFATVRENALLHAGFALDAKSLHSGQVWRLLTAQLVHVKQLHMLFNAALCWFLGNSLERALGKLQFAIIYWLGGSFGILATVILVPGAIGSGASQALMSLCSAVILLNTRGSFRSATQLVGVACAVVLIQLGLDLYVSHSPKPGYVVGFSAGMLLAIPSQFRRSKIA